MRQALFGILFLSILFLSNCNTHYNDFLQAPPLPDSNTYLLRSDNFNDYNENKDNVIQNWTNAAKKIYLWKLLISNNIEFYYQLLHSIQNSDIQPEYFANNTWLYEYDYLYDSSEYHVEFI